MRKRYCDACEALIPDGTPTGLVTLTATRDGVISTDVHSIELCVSCAERLKNTLNDEFEKIRSEALDDRMTNTDKED